MNDNFGKVRSAFVIPIFLFNFCSWGQGQESLFKEVEKIVKETPDSALHILNTNQYNLYLSNPNQFILHKAQAYQNIGKYDSSIHTISSYLLSEDRLFTDSNELFNILRIQSENYRVKEQYDLSLTLLLEILSFHERTLDTIKIIANHIQLVEFYRSTEDHHQALNFAYKCEKLLDNHSNSNLDLKARLYNRKAAVFTQIGQQIDSAISLSQAVIAIAKVLGNKELLASSYNELGFLYFNLEKDSAMHYFNRSVSIYEELKNYRYAVSVKANIARYYNSKKYFQKALAIYDSILLISLPNKYLMVSAESYEFQSKIYSEIGDYKKALEASNNSWRYRAMLKKIQNEKRLAEIESKFRWERTDQMLKQKQAALEEANVRAQNERLRKNQVYLLLIGVLIALIVVGMFYLRIIVANRKLKTSRLLLQNANLKLRDLIRQKESLLQEVNHRVKNNLSVLTGLIYLQKNSVENAEAKEALSITQNRITAMSLIHDSLYEQLYLSDSKFDEFIRKVCVLLAESFGYEKEEVRVEVNVSELNPSLEKSVPLAMLVNELVTNSFKHGFKNIKAPLIGLKYTKEKNELLVFDNGEGLVENKPGSIGLNLIHILAEQIDAKITTERKENLLVNTIRFKTEF